MPDMTENEGTVGVINVLSILFKVPTSCVKYSRFEAFQSLFLSRLTLLTHNRIHADIIQSTMSACMS